MALHPTSFIIHFNILLPSMPKSSQWSLLLRFSHQNPTSTTPFPLYASCHSNLILLDLSTQIVFGNKYRSCSSSLRSLLHSRYFVPLIPKYLPQHPIPQNPQPMFLSQRAQVSHPYKMGKIIFLHTLIFTFLDSKFEDKRICTE
jgi:hypothetical protein